MKKIYITTAIDYTNDVVHLGHSYQKVVADTIARYYRLTLGKENVYFVTGTDEHGGNIERIAKSKGKEPKAFVDEIVGENKKQWKALNISYDRFIRTTDDDHKTTVIDFWNKCKKDIAEKTFKGLYCFGCEAYKTESEVIDGKCPLHKTKQLEVIEEKNWFFLWKNYQKFLETHLDINRDFVVPIERWQEMRSFLATNLDDIPVSRPQAKISWGIPVPNDPTQVIYVWFDALINYFTAAKENGFWDKNTKIIHILGKDNTRWHALLWPAMLQSAGYRLPNTIYAHGFINLNGQKISKSLGNIIRPTELVDQYGTDAVRYYLLRFGPAEDDVDLSLEKLKIIYNADLANGLGNLISRVAKMAEGLTFSTQESFEFSAEYAADMKAFKFNEALARIWDEIRNTDKYINEQEPWKITDVVEKTHVLQPSVNVIRKIGFELTPFLPEIAEKIQKQFSGQTIQVTAPYFMRLKEE